MTRLRLRATVRLLTGHTTLRTHLDKIEHTQNDKNADCVDMIKRTLYTLYVTVLS